MVWAIDNMLNIKYSDILKLNKQFEKNLTTNSYKITILSNIIVHQVKEIFEYYLRSNLINASIQLGDYDNVVQDSQKFNKSDSVIIFWELCNLIDGLYYKIELLTDKELNAIYEKTRSEINLVFKNLEKSSLVLINRFTSFTFTESNVENNNFDKLAIRLNHFLENNLPSNIRLINLEKIISSIGINKSLDMRYFYSSKSLYTIEFFKAYAKYVYPYFMSANGKTKKALIFDCDNTLWKGVLGEDGFDNIEMSTASKDGSIFAEIQSIAISMNKQGILLGLCSKNNQDDINEVIRSHPDMQLRDKYITVNKSNWFDKVSNLKEISKELNIGLDSVVFIDDSSFEVNLVKESLPEVTVLQVPKNLYNYPKLLRECMGLFFNLSKADEDRKKINMYKHQVIREEVKKNFINIDDYLTSLGLIVTILINKKNVVSRIAQMSQKTNQFNLTTKRYTQADITNLMNDPKFDIYAFSVDDKFGDSGITGLCIIKYNNKIHSAKIDTLLMSCRIIGRNIEYAFFDYLVDELKKKKVNTVKAKYAKTIKNEQVKEFYEKCSFAITKSSGSIKNYILKTNNYKYQNLKYIKVINGK